MPHINATLKVNPPKDWTYWMSKPADHYELHYYSETTKRELVIYSSSLNELFRKFFLMSGNFYTTYTLNIPADLNPEKRNKIQGKFNSETEHFTRRLLGIGSNQPLPPKGPPLEAALEEAFINRKQGLKEKIKYQIKQIRKERNIWAGSTGVCAAALITIGILMAVSVLTPPIGPIVVRRLQPYQVNVGKRLVKSPKVYLRDAGLLHALLNIGSLSDLLGHPVGGTSWEGFLIENLIGSAPPLSVPGFYRTAAGAKIDLVLELPGGERWAIEIKRSRAARPARGFHEACADLQPARRYVVHAGADRYAVGDGIEAIGLRMLMDTLAQLV